MRVAVSLLLLIGLVLASCGPSEGSGSSTTFVYEPDAAGGWRTTPAQADEETPATATTTTSDSITTTTSVSTTVADVAGCVPEGLEADGWIVDAAGVLTSEADLEGIGEYLGLQHSCVVVLISDSGPCTTDEVAIGILEVWGRADPALHDGFVVLVDLGKGAALVRAGPGIRVSREILGHTAQAGFEDFGAGDFDTGILAIMLKLDLLFQELAARPQVDADRTEVMVGTPGIGHLELVGTARASDGSVSLTRKQSTHQSGAVWLPSQVEVGTGFESQFVFEIDHVSWYSIGDGFAFVIQDNYTWMIGSGASGNGYDGIPHSLAVEFDTVFHDYVEDPRFPIPGDDPPALLSNHVAIHTRGPEPNRAHGSAMLEAVGLQDIKLYDRRHHIAHVRYVPGTLSVFIDDLNTPIITAQIDLEDLLELDDGAAYVGFTAGTEPGSHTDFLIHSWTFDTCAESTDDKQRCTSD